MTTSLSIKDVPENLVERLKRRAKRNHRSLRGELIAILEQAASEEKLTVAELHRRVSELGMRTPSDSVQIIREMRDSRYGPNDERVK